MFFIAGVLDPIMEYWNVGIKKMNIEHRTSNVQLAIGLSASGGRASIYPPPVDRMLNGKRWLKLIQRVQLL
jgi:hypothetical protein